MAKLFRLKKSCAIKVLEAEFPLVLGVHRKDAVGESPVHTPDGFAFYSQALDIHRKMEFDPSVFRWGSSGTDLNAGTHMVVENLLQFVEVAAPHLVRFAEVPGVCAVIVGA